MIEVLVYCLGIGWRDLLGLKLIAIFILLCFGNVILKYLNGAVVGSAVIL